MSIHELRLKRSTDSDFVSLDEFTDAYTSLEKLLDFVSDVEKNPYNLKWAIIALHSAIQGFMICLLQGTSILDDINVIYHKSNEVKAILKCVDDNFTKCKILSEGLGKFVKLKSFLKLYEESKKKLKIKNEYDVSFERLNTEIRNQFVHYAPMSWSIEKALLYEIIFDGCSFLQNICSDHCFTRYDGNDCKKINEHINVILETIRPLRNNRV